MAPPKKNKPQQQNQLQQNQHAHQAHTHHDHGNCGHNHGEEAAAPNPASALSIMDSFKGISGLQQMLSGLQGMGLGGATIKPDDPLPDFTQFDQSKQIIENSIEDLKTTIELIQSEQYDKLEKVQVQKPPAAKLNKKQQQQKDQNNNILKSNIDYLNGIQNELKVFLKDPLLNGIQVDIESGIKNLQLDVQYYQKLLEG